MAALFRRLLQGGLWLVAFVAIIATAGLGGQLIMSAVAQSDDVAEPLPVAVMTARYQDTYRQRRLFAGRIAPAQAADVGFQLPGEVAAVTVEVGDRVDAGAPLAELDPVRVELRRRESAAALREAQAVQKRAESAFARVEQLIAEGFATDQERDNALADRNTARERTELLRRSLARAAEDVDDLVLRAPFSGFVVARYIDAGATVSAGQPVVRINEQGSLEAEIGVPLDFARRLSAGDVYTLTTDADDADATVLGVSDEVEAATRTRLVRFRIDEAGSLAPGSLVRVALNEERRARGVWVPLVALQESYRGLWSVYVVEANEEGDEVIRRKDVTIISLGAERAFVSGTLEDGDQVVVTSPFRFVPGQKVTIVPDPDDAPGMAAAPSVSAT